MDSDYVDIRYYVLVPMHVENIQECRGQSLKLAGSLNRVLRCSIGHTACYERMRLYCRLFYLFKLRECDYTAREGASNYNAKEGARMLLKMPIMSLCCVRERVWLIYTVLTKNFHI
jgi:hypothetical protein